MRILSWNCRGLGKSSAVHQCEKTAHELNPDLMFLMETHLPKDRGKKIWDKCGFKVGWELPREGMSGGLLLAWMDRQKLHIVYESKYLVHMDLLDNRGNPISITFVYGQTELSKREEVWCKLRELKLMAHQRWLCIGDFNQILSVKEKFSFDDGPIPGAKSFQLLVSDLQLCDSVAQGQQFTWTNKREGGNFVMERLDRAFATVEWIETYPNYALTNHPIIKSDHGPITLDFDLKLPFQRRPF